MDWTSSDDAQQVCSGHRMMHGSCYACKASRLSICAHVDSSGLAELRRISTWRSFAKGDMIFEEQSAVHDVFILTDGMVKLYRLLEDGRRQITGFLVTGDILGSPKREASAHCTAQAVTDLQACAFERSAFFGLLLRYRDLALRLLIMATDEIETQHEHTVIIGRKRTDERLAAFLVTLHARWTEAGETEEVVHLPMSRADIGDYLGLTIESVSRAFSRLKGAGVIDIPSPHRIVLRNLPALHDLAGLEHLPARTVTLGL